MLLLKSYSIVIFSTQETSNDSLSFAEYGHLISKDPVPQQSQADKPSGLAPKTPDSFNSTRPHSFTLKFVRVWDILWKNAFLAVSSLLFPHSVAALVDALEKFSDLQSFFTNVTDGLDVVVWHTA